MTDFNGMSMSFTKQRLMTILEARFNLDRFNVDLGKRPRLVTDTVDEIMRELRAIGWATPGEVRAIVAAAGVRIEIPEDTLDNPPQNLRSWMNHETGSMFLEVEYERDRNDSA